MLMFTYLLKMHFSRGHHSFAYIDWLTIWVLLSEISCTQSWCQNKCSLGNSSQNMHVYQTFVKNKLSNSSEIMCKTVETDKMNYYLFFTFSCSKFNCEAAAYLTTDSTIFSLDGKKHYHDLPSIDDLTNNCTYRSQKNISFPQSDVLSLEMNMNCITRFPLKYFCNMSNLVHLDLSCNGLRDPIDNLMGFDASCNVSCCACNLTSLSLKNNFLETIARNTFCAFPKLTSLDLSYNQLESAHEEVFSNLPNLELLDMSNNKFVTLPATIFLPITKIESLDLSSNKLNQKKELRLQTLPPEIFKTLVNLQNLSLFANSISELKDDLKFLRNLVSLDLTFIGLQIMPESVFYPLVNLSYLKLSRNPNIQLPMKVFLKSKNLRELSISKCNLKQFPNIGNLSRLTSLDLSENQISVLNKNDLINLHLLKTLDLRSNAIQDIASGSFDNIKYLNVLMLDNNKIHNLVNVLQKSSMQKLSLNYNMIRNFSFDYIPPDLQILYLQNNNISQVVKSNNIRNIIIQSLYLKNNNIFNLEGFQMPPSIRLLELDNNRISSISFVKYDESQPVVFVDNTTSITLKNNNLTSFCFTLIMLLHSKVVPIFDLRRNPLRCACELMYSYFLFDPIPTSAKTDTCSPIVNSSSQDLMHFQNDIEQLTCETVLKNVTCQCNLLTDYSRMCLLHCPEECFCYIDKRFSTYFINCRSRNLTVIPAAQSVSFQTNVTFSFNNLRKISPEDLVPFTNAIAMYLDHNFLETVTEGAFQHIINVQVLTLDSNLITHLPSDFLDNLKHLQELQLRNNRLRDLSPSVFSPLVTLQMLTLDHNLFSDFPVWELPSWNATFRLSLSENPWSCNCTFVEPFRKWLQNAVSIVSDAEHLRCGPTNNYSETNNSFIFFNSSICYNPGVRILTITSVTMLVTSLTALLVLVILAVMIFIYRREMQVLLYSRYGIRLFNETADEAGLKYDAFLSYSNDDGVFVYNEILPNLEMENAYKICVHERDFLAGNFISDSIQDAVHNSYRTIVVLSDSFLRSEWCMFEFKTAYHKMLTDRCNRVIVIILGKLTVEMDPDLKLYMKTNTYLKWGDKLFWEKLYYALPDKRVE